MSESANQPQDDEPSYHRRLIGDGGDFAPENRPPRGKGRVGVITGGGSGIGASIGQWLAREGSDVVLADVDVAAAEETAREVDARAGGSVRAHRVDVTEESSVESLVESVRSQEGRLDYLFANAGVSGPITLAETGYEEWRSVLGVNLDGVFLSVRKSLPLLERGRDPSHVVVTSSISGRKPKPVMIPYRTSKAAAIMLTRCLAAELGPDVRVNALCPSSIETPMLRDNYERRAAEQGLSVEEFIERREEELPLGRSPTREDVLQVLDFLLFQNGFVTGQEFHIDGGGYQAL